jgi:acyl-CoA reductase-like NAD-dependent aldehyde dehydrogenase
MALQLKLAFAAAMKAKRAWDRLPPEQRQRIIEGTKTTVRTQGPVVAKKVAATAKTHGEPLARRLAKAVQAARNSSK